MTNLHLSKTALLINFLCVLIGVSAYSKFVSNDQLSNTIFFSLLVFSGSFISSIYISRRFRDTPLESNSGEKNYSNSSFVKFILVFPIILTLFEVVSLYFMHAKPEDVSWIHIVAAGAVGTHAEVVFMKRQ